MESGFVRREGITREEPSRQAAAHQHFQLLRGPELLNVYGPWEGSTTVPIAAEARRRAVMAPSAKSFQKFGTRNRPNCKYDQRRSPPLTHTHTTTTTE